MKATDILAPAFEPARNPLSHEHHADTMIAVQGVLGFLQHAILSMSEQDAVEYNINIISDGLFSILETCRTALDVHQTTKGGAA